MAPDSPDSVAPVRVPGRPAPPRDDACPAEERRARRPPRSRRPRGQAAPYRALLSRARDTNRWPQSQGPPPVPAQGPRGFCGAPSRRAARTDSRRRRATDQREVEASLVAAERVVVVEQGIALLGERRRARRARTLRPRLRGVSTSRASRWHTRLLPHRPYALRRETRPALPRIVPPGNVGRRRACARRQSAPAERTPPAGTATVRLGLIRHGSVDQGAPPGTGGVTL